MAPSTIGVLNRLPEDEKRRYFGSIVPEEMIQRFNIPRSFIDSKGRDLMCLSAPKGSTSVEMSLFHEAGFPDPVLYGHLTDTVAGQIHILLYVLNDPSSPRFDIDVLPNGVPTKMGSEFRNLDAELAAMRFGLAPGQVRRGLRLLTPAIDTFEKFIQSLEHGLYFAEPLYYHNAILFERHGFAYQKGRKLMERITQGLSDGGDLLPKLDGSSPFRQPQARNSIRLRSWAIHDGILGEPFTGVTMYKHIGKDAGLNTCPGCDW